MHYTMFHSFSIVLVIFHFPQLSFKQYLMKISDDINSFYVNKLYVAVETNCFLSSIKYSVLVVGFLSFTQTFFIFLLVYNKKISRGARNIDCVLGSYQIRRVVLFPWSWCFLVTLPAVTADYNRRNVLTRCISAFHRLPHTTTKIFNPIKSQHKTYRFI